MGDCEFSGPHKSEETMQQASHNMTKSLSLIAAVAHWSLSVRRIAGVIGMRGNRGL